MLKTSTPSGVKSLVGRLSEGRRNNILVCFPHAGGGPSVFSGWRKELPETMDMLAVQLPGREMRANETPLRDARQGAAQVGAELAKLLFGYRPDKLIFFGHSLGALLAYETARWLEDNQDWGPTLVLAAGRRAPDLPLNRSIFHTLNDAGFIIEIQKMGGSPPGIFDDPRLTRFFLPTIRADVEMTDSYEHRAAPPLRARIVAAYGDLDTMATQVEVEGWSRFTQLGSFQSVRFSGGHFFIRPCKSQLIDIIKRA